MKAKKPLVVNLFAGPGYGKSTCAAYLFFELKKRHIEVVNVAEFSKDLWYYSGVTPPYNEAYVFGNQLFRIEQACEKADVVITDSPLPLCIVYNDREYLKESFERTVMETFASFRNINFLINDQMEDYSEIGRYQNEEESVKIHNRLIHLLDGEGVDYHTIKQRDYGDLVDRVLKQI